MDISSSPLSEQEKPRRLLVCASGRCLWDDLERLGPWDGEVMCINEAGLGVKTFQHWASVHYERFQWWLPLKENRHVNDEYFPAWKGETYAPKPYAGVRHVHKFDGVIGGSSSLYGVLVGLHVLGCEQVILAGAPYDTSGRFFDQPGPGHDYAITDGWKIWRKLAALEFRGRVKSLSGRTRDLLGEP